jgi:putative membrane protein
VILLGDIPMWLLIKLGFVFGLLLYHFSLHALYKQQRSGKFKFSSQQLRLWNEVATIFLVAIVFLVEVKTALSALWALIGLVGFVIILMSAIRIYKSIRSK